MADRRERTFDEVNDISEREYHESTMPGKTDEPNPAYCKTCKYSEKKYNGKPFNIVNKEKYPNWKAGTCEKYDIKPHNVYFDGAKCPKFEAK